ncbi:hypothetical protein PG987_013894 [Apiospora arundinis]
MQIIKFVIAAVASASAVHALPASGTTESKTEDKRAPQADYDGVRSLLLFIELTYLDLDTFTSCYLAWAFQNIPCTQGTSTAQSGGGDGKTCRIHDFGNGNAYAICPGHS